jgi:lipopolysaccharide transport system permease protein
LSLFLLGGLAFGFGIIISSINTKYRDLTQFVGFGMNLLMFATPIVYAFSLVPDNLKEYLKFNPLLAPIECFKYALFGTGYFTTNLLFYSFICTSLLLFLGLILFSRAEKNFNDTV